MEQLIQQVASGLANGAIYACLALALVMIFVSTDHINFAQGELAMFSAYLAWQALEWGLSFWLALPAVALFSFLIGVGIERVILRPLHHAPVLSVVVVFIGLLAIFHSLAGAIWGHTIKAIPSPFPHITFVGSGYIGPHQIGMILVTVVLLLALFAFFRFTPLGLAMRAAAQNPASARLAGIRVDWMLALGWGLAAAIGAVAGIAGGAGRLSGAQHDGEHPALRLRRRAGRRHLEPGRRRRRRLHRRRAGEPDRLPRQPAREGDRRLHHRQRRKADGGAHHRHHRSDAEAQRPVRPCHREAGLSHGDHHGKRRSAPSERSPDRHSAAATGCCAGCCCCSPCCLLPIGGKTGLISNYSSCS